MEDISYRIDNSDSQSVICDPIDDAEITFGSSVVVKSLNATGIVKSVNFKRREAEVQVGSIKTKVSFSDLGKPVTPKKAEKNTQISKNNKKHAETATSGFSEKEIKVLGLTVSEAIEVIEPFIIAMNSEDDAKILKIVHGKGTGALAKGIQAYLKSNPLVAEYRYGRYGEGDNGVTFATIK